MRKPDAQTRVHTLTSEIHFSVQVLDLRGQAELEQVETVTAGRDTVSKSLMREEVTQEQEKRHLRTSSWAPGITDPHLSLCFFFFFLHVVDQTTRLLDSHQWCHSVAKVHCGKCRCQVLKKKKNVWNWKGDIFVSAVYPSTVSPVVL